MDRKTPLWETFWVSMLPFFAVIRSMRKRQEWRFAPLMSECEVPFVAKEQRSAGADAGRPEPTSGPSLSQNGATSPSQKRGLRCEEMKPAAQSRIRKELVACLRYGLTEFRQPI